MGDIVKITGKEVLPDPEGWNVPKEQFNLPFTVELKENFHIHWHDLRIEMMPKDFEKFAKAITKAYQKWEDDGTYAMEDILQETTISKIGRTYYLDVE